MRLSTLFGKTLRPSSSDFQAPVMISLQLLVRAAFVRPMATGQVSYLPLGVGAVRRLESLRVQHLKPLHGQEIAIPSPSLTECPHVSEVEDAGHLPRLVAREIDSYRQLPLVLYQRGTIAEDRPGFRSGLFGATERPVVEISLFTRIEPGTNEPQLVACTAALDRVFKACGVAVAWIGAGHDGCCALFDHPSGDKQWVDCLLCDYAAEHSWATAEWPEPPREDDLPREEIATPGCDTIAVLAHFLSIPAARTLKVVFYSVDGRVTCVAIRGDRSVDEAKLARLLGTHRYYASLEGELAAIGAVGGYASPIGLVPERVRVVADRSVSSGVNYVSGANRPGFHFRNASTPRDFTPDAWADLASIESGDPCPRCGAPLQIINAFELARGTTPTQLDARYLDQCGRAQPLSWAGWRLYLGRLLAAVVETHHDTYGILWPAACAPFDVHLVALDLRREGAADQALALYRRLKREGFAVLFDDREASAGVKFNDADLIGLPLRLTTSKRAETDGLIEAKWRDSQERHRADGDALAAELARLRQNEKGGRARDEEIAI